MYCIVREIIVGSMEYYNSFHSISEFLKQGKGCLLVDSQRLHNAQRQDRKIKKSRLLQLIELAQQNKVTVEQRSPQQLQGLLEQGHYRGYILALQPSSGLQAKAQNIGDIITRKPPLVLLLDGVLDVGNLGAIVRNADSFGAGAVFISYRSAGGRYQHNNQQNQLGRASSGANAWVPTIAGNLAQMAKQLQGAGYWLYGADMQGRAVAQQQFSQPCALLLGSEESGISPQLRGQCDALVSIPTEGHLDSLNVSAAAAVLMYEVKRQSR